MRTITVLPSVPVIICASNKTVQCGSGWTFDPPWASDNCCTNLTYGLLSSNGASVGSCVTIYAGVWQVTDCCSNSSVCTQWVTEVKSPPPIVTPGILLDYSTVPGSRISFAGGGFTFIGDTNGVQFEIDDVIGGSGDAYAFRGYISSAGPFAIGPITPAGLLETAPVTGSGILHITDGVHEFTGTVQWLDIATVGGGGVLNLTGQVNLTALTYAGASVDLRDLAASVTAQVDLTFQFIPARTLTQLKATGGLTDYSGTILGAPVQLTPPLISCATNKTVPCGMAWTFDPPTVSDNCCGSNVTVSIQSTVTNPFAPLTVTRTWLATDCCSNSVECSQTVMVLGNCPPCLTFSCPSNLAVSCQGANGAVVSYPVWATNNCGAHEIGIICVPPSGSTFLPGMTSVNCTISSSNETWQCSFTVIVDSQQVPPLHIVPFTPGKFKVWWQRPCTDVILEGSSSLGPDRVWSPVPEPVQSLGDEDFVIVSSTLGGPAMFFRLRRAAAGDVMLASDAIAVAAAAGVSSNALAEVAQANNLTLLRGLPGNVFLYSLPQRTERAALKTLLEAIRQQAPQLINQAGLVANPLGAELPLIVTDEFIAQFHQNVDRATIDALNATHSVQVVFENPFYKNHFLVRATAASTGDAMELSRRYAQSALVEYAEPNYILFGQDRAHIPNDVLFANQWHLHNTGQGGGTVDADIDAPEAWDITTGSPAVVIAAIDTGFDVTHPDLVPNLWVNSSEIPGNGRDDDGNDLVDDVNGWNFADNNSLLAGGAHGTSVAGCAAARGDNLLGVSGSCPNCHLMLIRHGGVSTPGDALWATTTMKEAQAFDYARLKGAHIITCSFGYPARTPLAQLMTIVTAINRAATLGRAGLAGRLPLGLGERGQVAIDLSLRARRGGCQRAEIGEAVNGAGGAGGQGSGDGVPLGAGVKGGGVKLGQGRGGAVH